jgi:hypothetical protein
MHAIHAKSIAWCEAIKYMPSYTVYILLGSIRHVTYNNMTLKLGTMLWSLGPLILTLVFDSSFGVSLPFWGMNPGLVEEGTKCGDGMVCELQRCVSLSSQSFPTCPSANGQQCSGPSRGVSSSVVASYTCDGFDLKSRFAITVDSALAMLALLAMLVRVLVSRAVSLIIIMHTHSRE